MNKDMKRCPFCGGKPTLTWDIKFSNTEDEEWLYLVACFLGDGGCGVTTGHKSTKEEAIEAWGQRVDED